MSSRKNSRALPDRVHPLGVPFKVLLVEEVDADDSAGETCGEYRHIKVCSKQDTRRRWTTLLHEYMHATLVINGISSVLDSDLEEIVVQSLEHSLEQFLLVHGQQLLEALSVQSGVDT